MAYLITFTCYGTRLYGDEGGSVDRNHNIYGTPFLPSSTKRVSALQRAMNQETYELDSVRRAVVLEAIRQVCIHRAWKLRAAHVRSTHIHLIVTARMLREKFSLTSKRMPAGH